MGSDPNIKQIYSIPGKVEQMLRMDNSRPRLLNFSLFYKQLTVDDYSMKVYDYGIDLVANCDKTLGKQMSAHVYEEINQMSGVKSDHFNNVLQPQLQSRYKVTSFEPNISIESLLKM